GIGTGLDADGVGEVSLMEGPVNAVLSLALGIPGLNSHDDVAQQANADATTDRFTISDTLSTAEAAANDTTAAVGANAQVNAGGSLSVKAVSGTDLHVKVGGAGLDVAAVGAGASHGFARLAPATTASVG